MVKAMLWTVPMQQFLFDDQTESREIYGRGGVMTIHCVTHNGGTWMLQLRHPTKDEWTNIDEFTFTKKDVFTFYAYQGSIFRLSGGDEGGEAFVYNADVASE